MSLMTTINNYKTRLLTWAITQKTSYEAGAQNEEIINYVIALILLFLLMPVALGNFFNVTTTGWDNSVVTIWKILPILAIIGAFSMVLYMGYSKSGLGRHR